MAENKVNVSVLGVFLGGIAALAAGLLAFVSEQTNDAIAANRLKKTTAALERVLPAFDNVPADETLVFDAPQGWPVTFYVARKDGKPVGFAGEVVTPKGFSGDVTVMVGLNADASVRKVIVVKNNETPGLGTVVCDRKNAKTLFDVLSGKKPPEGLPPNPLLDQYEERKAGASEWKVKKDGGDVDAKTGATITSRAVCGAVYAVAETAGEHLEELSKGAE